MKFFVFLCIVASAAAFKGEPLIPGIAFPEDIENNSDRIIQGWPAAAGQFPHQAFLITSDDSGSSFACGGSLISTRWVVTAAHCLYRLTQAQVHLGSTSYSSSPVKITTRGVYVHPNYNPNNLNNDVALIDLQQDVQVTANIKPIRIVSQVSDAYVGRVTIVSGFGRTTNTGSISQSLNFVNLTVITNSLCSQTYGNDVIIASTICGVGIRSGAQGSCNGDSGGPLILQGDGDDILAGIVSFVSTAGCDANVPSGFVRPNHFISWLNQVTGITFE